LPVAISIIRSGSFTGGHPLANQCAKIKDTYSLRDVALSNARLLSISATTPFRTTVLTLTLSLEIRPTAESDRYFSQ